MSKSTTDQSVKSVEQKKFYTAINNSSFIRQCGLHLGLKESIKNQPQQQANCQNMRLTPGSMTCTVGEMSV